MCGSCPHLSDDACFALARRYLEDSLKEARRSFASITPKSMGGFTRRDMLEMALHLGGVAKQLDEEIRVNDCSYVQSSIPGILSTYGHHLEPDSEEWNLFAHYLSRAVKEDSLYQRHLFANGLDRPGSWRLSDPLFASEETERNGQVSGPGQGYDRSTASVTARSIASDSISFAKLVERFIREKSPGLKERSALKYKEHLRIAERYFGSNTAVSDISRARVREYRDILTQLPRDFLKARRFASMDLCALATLPVSEKGKLLGPASVNAYLGTLSHFFRYGSDLAYCADNPATKMAVKDPVKPRDKRDTFSKTDLEVLFRQPFYTGCDGCHWDKPGKFRDRGTRFWVPIVALFTGMRRGEIFGLTPERLLRFDGSYAFDITEAKTDNGIRLVPVHPMLIELGLLEFIRATPANTLIFRDQSDDALGKFFARLIKSARYPSSKLTFHSLRHTFTDAARAARIGKEIIQALVGHSGGSVTDAYGTGYPFEVLAEAMQKITFWGLDLSHLRAGDGSPAKTLPTAA